MNSIQKLGPRDLIRSLRAIKRRPANTPSIVLFEDFLEDIRLRGDTEQTYRTYKSTCSDFLDFIGDLPLASVRPRDIRDFLAWRYQRGATNNTLAKERYALGSFFKFLERLEIVLISPCRSVPIRKWKRKLPKTLALEQIEKLIEAADNPRDRAIITVFYSTGCRLSELTGMKIEELQQGKRWSVRVTGKRDKERIVPLNSRAIEALKPVIGDRKSGFIFQSSRRAQGNGSLCITRGYWFYQWFDRGEVEGETCSRGRCKALGIVADSERANRARIHRINGKRLEVLTSEQAEAAALKFLTETLHRTPRTDLDRSLNPRSVYLIVVRAARKAGLDVHPHMLRHSFATHLHDGGADILTIKELLGHASVTTTTIYTHVSQTKIEETMRRYHPHWQEDKQ